MSRNLVGNVQFQLAIGHASLGVAGTSDLEAEAADCVDFLAVVAMVHMGVIAAGAVTSVKWQGSDDATTWADLAGTDESVADTDDNKMLVMELDRPRHRYNRIVISRATANATVRSAIYIKRLPRNALTSMDPADVIVRTIHSSP